jgi:hypothetical protein
MAKRPNLKRDKIHVYGHSQHNHPMKSEGKWSYTINYVFNSQKLAERSIHRSEKMLMPDVDPPKDFYTDDNIEWTFLRTVSDVVKLNEFRLDNHCKLTTSLNGQNIRIRFYCSARYNKDCKFMLLAMKTTENGYHVYKYDEHEHAVPNRKSKLAIKNCFLLYIHM